MEKELETRKKTAKISRRTAKAALTGSGKLVNNLIEGKRPKHEVREMLANDKLQNSFNELVIKHKAYTALIDGDHEFEEEEAWLGECQENFIKTEYRAKVYLDLCDEGEGKIEIDGKGVSSKETIQVAESEGISVMHVTSAPLQCTNKESDIIQITSVPSDPTSSNVDDIRDFKIWYGWGLVRRKMLKITSGDVMTHALVRPSRRSLTVYYGELHPLAYSSLREYKSVVFFHFQSCFCYPCFIGPQINRKTSLHFTCFTCLFRSLFYRPRSARALFFL